MHFFLPPFLVLLLCFKASESYKNTSSCLYALHATNDGPVTLDVPVTINATLDCVDKDDGLVYVYEFQIEGKKVSVAGHGTASATFLFTDLPGTRVVQVTAYATLTKLIEVASAKTSFEVFAYIPGKLKFTGIKKHDETWCVATGKDVNISVELHYPPHVLKHAELSFSWTFGESRFVTSKTYKVVHFEEPGRKRIHAAVVARISSYDGSSISRYKWGYFEDELIVKAPFSNINITGNTYLQHGQLLNLDIYCNGSGPLKYCWKVLPFSENRTNLSCTDPVSVTECSFPIIYYFRDSGEFLLAIFIDNLVSSMQRNVEIHIYDVSLTPQLSTVIIPLVCTVLVVFIVATAVVMHMRRHRNYDIETADFDFMRADESSGIFIDTSWEVMRRSLLHLLRLEWILCPAEAPRVNYGAILHGQESTL